MRFVASAILFLFFAVVGFSQADELSVNDVLYSAISIHGDDRVQTLDGQVQIETANVIIRADKAIIDEKTMDIQPLGNVHIILKK